MLVHPGDLKDKALYAIDRFQGAETLAFLIR